MAGVFSPKVVVLVLFACLMLGILASPFLLSLSYIGLIISSLYIQNKEDWQPFTITAYWKNLRNMPILWTYLLYFVVVCIDFILGPKNEWSLTHLRLQLPFLLMPLVFANLPPLSKKDLVHFGYAFLGIVTLVNALVFLNYLWDKTAIDLSIRMGKSIPTPYSHIRHAILTAVAVLYVLKTWFWRRKEGNLRLLWFLGGLQVLFLHFLAVRTGLLILYIFLGGFVLYLIWLEKKWKLALMGLIAALLLGIVSIYSIPSLQNKLGYMWYDLEQGKLNKGAQYSDSNRLKSWELAWYHIREKPSFGHRIARVKEKMEESYRRLPGHQSILPHSQYIFWLMGLGIFLGGTALGFLFFPVFEVQNKFFFLFTLHSLGMAVSMLVENTLLTSMGVAIFIFFSCFALRYEVGFKA